MQNLYGKLFFSVKKVLLWKFSNMYKSEENDIRNLYKK